MQLRIDSQGQITCVYDEMVDLTALGPLTIRRASHVEPDDTGQWWADLAPVGGPRLGPFRLHSEALAAERDWLESHWCAGSVRFPFDGPTS
jgi:hypothetical protein